jgi:AAA15 family ATPase/GTPase
MFKLGDHESVGTTQLFGFAAVVLDALDYGHTLMIDEFGSSLHPFISSAIVKQFVSKKTNRNGAQLIVFTHESYLLSKKSDLRRDQIWFVDKNEREETTMRSLAEYKTRNDYEVAKNYLEGRFGALPRLTFDQG